jgi:membrane protease YdiL (CAAX protease family)
MKSPFISPPSGFQLAFLYLASQFFAMLAASFLSKRIDWPEDRLNLLGNLISFGVWLAIIFSITPLREFALRALGPRLTGAALREAIAVGVAKVSSPLAIAGALVLWGVMAGHPPAPVPSAEDVAAMDARASSAFGWLHFAIAISLGPFVEELLYRGFLYQAWERQFGWFRSMVATSLFFAILHPTHMVSSAIGSVVYVCLLRRTGTLWAPIVAHALFNLLVQWHVLGRPLQHTGDFFHMSCLAFVCVALPAYVWKAHRLRADAAARLPAP